MDAPLDPPEVVEVDSEIVACEGEGGALGHPRVFLNMEGKGQIDCPYCDRRFVLRSGAKASGGH
ncbi:MAG: zinc-finger domain-containing protein [Kiloniellales bacterium]|nr:zinc-finger domain-containing protein [Kiloniellales bacterium]